MRRVGEVADRRQRDRGGLGAGEEQELVDLVAADIAEDPAIARRVEEPVGPQMSVQPVRPHAERLHHGADRAGADQLGSAGDGADLEALGITDRPYPPGFGDDPAQFCASVVQPGLSVITSLPCRIAAMAMAARSDGIAAVRIRAIDGSSSRRAWSATRGISGKRLRNPARGCGSPSVQNPAHSQRVPAGGRPARRYGDGRARSRRSAVCAACPSW